MAFLFEVRFSFLVLFSFSFVLRKVFESILNVRNWVSANRELLELGHLCLDVFWHSFSNFFTNVDLTSAKSEYQRLRVKPEEISQKQNFFSSFPNV